MEFTKSKPCATPDCGNKVTRVTFCTKETQPAMEKAFDETDLFCDECTRILNMADSRIAEQADEDKIQAAMAQIQQNIKLKG